MGKTGPTPWLAGALSRKIICSSKTARLDARVFTAKTPSRRPNHNNHNNHNAGEGWLADWLADYSNHVFVHE